MKRSVCWHTSVAVAGATLGFGAGGLNASEAPRPNILLIVADDMGYGDVAILRGDRPWTNLEPLPEGVEAPLTPNLDALARTGRILTDFYANAPLCSPTRAALLTARYQQRSGVISVLGQLGGGLKKVGMPDVFAGWGKREVTLIDALNEAGYRTGMFGKSHLPGHPLDMGFETYVGAQGGGGDNFALRTKDGKSMFFRDRQAVDAPGGWYTDVLADEALAFMTDPKDKRPFFAYVPFTAPHVPLFGPNDREISAKWDGSDPLGFGPREDRHQAYVDVIEGLDAAIGRIIAGLDAAGVRDQTLIFFTSDNGPVDVGSAEPFRGRKSRLDEGGIRVPGIVNWPGHVPPGTKCNTPTMTMDLLPTFVHLAGGALPANHTYDGLNIDKVFFDECRSDRFARSLFWEVPRGVEIAYYDQRVWAVRDGKWKLRHSLKGETELFDLEADPREENDVLAAHPEIAERMEMDRQIWRSDVVADAPFDETVFIGKLRDAGLLISAK